MAKVAIVLVRGLVNVNQGVKDNLTMLHLTRKNNCVVVEDSAVMRGMIKKSKDYITWGEISEETFSLLLEKKGEEFKS